MINWSKNWKKIEAEKSNAEEVWQKAMETSRIKHKDGNSGSKQEYGSETMGYLKNSDEQESYFK